MKKLLALLVSLLVASSALAGNNLGDYDTSTVIYGKFTTVRPSTGASFTLAGSPALSVYKDNSTTQSTTGVTLTADFDSVTGLNHFAIDTSADGTFYSAGSFFDIVITTGTVDSVSVVGQVVGQFTLRKTSALKPATAGRTVVIDANGLADANTVKLGPSGSGTAQTARDIGASVLLSNGTGTGQVSLSSGTVTAGALSAGAINEAAFATTAGSFYPLEIVDQGTAQGATATTLQLRSAATFSDNELVGAKIIITGGSAGVGQSATITAYTGSTDTATVATWPTTPSGTITYKVFGVPPGAGGTVSIGAGGITASSFAASAITAAAIASNAITSAKIAADAIGASQIADGAIDEATFASTGGFGPLGIIDQGTAQAVTSTTLQFRSAANFADSEILGATCVITSASTGVGQSRTVSAYVSSTDTATLDSAWTTTPTGTIKYVCFGTALGASSALTAADVWNYGTRELTSIDEDRTTLDLNATAVGSLTTDPAGVTTLLTRVGTPAGASVSADVAAVKAVLPSALVGGKMDSHVNDLAANAITAASINADAITAAKIAADADTEIGAAVNTAQGVITGVCSSGSTTTCVDAALTQAAASQLQDRLMCFDDNWCALITTFNPATDTATTTKTAPSTRASKAYAIYPATAQ